METLEGKIDNAIKRMQKLRYAVDSMDNDVFIELAKALDCDPRGTRSFSKDSFAEAILQLHKRLSELEKRK